MPIGQDMVFAIVDSSIRQQRVMRVCTANENARCPRREWWWWRWGSGVFDGGDGEIPPPENF
jgi:hypothetical protein